MTNQVTRTPPGDEPPLLLDSGGMSSSGHRAVALGRAYFALQAAAGAAWWASVFASDRVREATLGGIDPVAMAAFDIPLFVIVSALVALGVRAAVWVVAPWTVAVALGMALYAMLTGLAGWGAVLMIAAAAGGIAAGALVWFGRLPTDLVLIGPLGFRTARAGGTAKRVLQTGAQIVVFWGLFLAVIPIAIVVLEERWGLHVEAPLWARIFGAVLLVATSALGIWSAAVMATLGDGTPLPAAMANRLVIAGPYRCVRNPMAVAGIAQGVAVGLLASSWLTVLYALAGSLVWNWLVRPVEEADLLERFGDDFADYRAEVSCWIPRLRATAPRSAV